MNYFEMMMLGEIKQRRIKAGKQILDILGKHQQQISRWYQTHIRKFDQTYIASSGDEAVTIQSGPSYDKTNEGNLTHRRTVVVTPIEIVDFIVESSIDQLIEQAPDNWVDRAHFFDPFAGSGIFMCRTMQHLRYGEKYHLDIDMIKQIWDDGDFECYEITPFGSYVCKLNMEQTYHVLTGEAPDTPANVQCRDTFVLESEREKGREKQEVLIV